jgi:hypothetical protein
MAMRTVNSPPLRKLALDLAVPAGEPIGIGECSPEVVDPGVEAIFHPHHALAVDRMETSQHGCIGSHLDPPLFARSQRLSDAPLAHRQCSDGRAAGRSSDIA